MVARGILFRWRTAVRRRFCFAVPSAGRLIWPFSNGPPFEQLAASSAKCAGRHFTPGPGAMTISIGEPSTLDRSGAVASYCVSGLVLTLGISGPHPGIGRLPKMHPVTVGAFDRKGEVWQRFETYRLGVQASVYGFPRLGTARQDIRHHGAEFFSTRPLRRCPVLRWQRTSIDGSRRSVFDPKADFAWGWGAELN
jgi:hypothetical protein